MRIYAIKTLPSDLEGHPTAKRFSIVEVKGNFGERWQRVKFWGGHTVYISFTDIVKWRSIAWRGVHGNVSI